jgi:hypothetical protein
MNCEEKEMSESEEIEVSEYEASRIDKLREKKARKQTKPEKVIPEDLEYNPKQTKEELMLLFPNLDAREIEMLLDLSGNGSEGDIYCRKKNYVKTIYRVNKEGKIEKISSKIEMTEGEINRLIMRYVATGHHSLCHQCKKNPPCVEWRGNKYCFLCALKKRKAFYEILEKKLPPSEKLRLSHEAMIRRIKEKKK